MVATPSAQPSTPAISLATLRAVLAELHAQEPEHGARLDRAASIVAIRSIERTAGGYLVESERDPGTFYLVTLSPFGAACICQDYRRRNGLACKHILATKLLRLCERMAAEQAPIPFPTRYYSDSDRFVLTAKGLAALEAAAPEPVA